MYSAVFLVGKGFRISIGISVSCSITTPVTELISSTKTARRPYTFWLLEIAENRIIGLSS